MNSPIRIAFYSDTHLRDDLIFPEKIDIFIHCGDMLNKGSLDELRIATAYFKEKLKGRKLYYTPGNHDNILEKPESIKILKEAGIETLIDQRLTISCKGHSISCYFMPWVPETILTHAFNLEDGPRQKYIDLIPSEGIDILVTHGPPDYVLDSDPEDGYHFGDMLLKAKIESMKGLKVHAFGHIHGGRGTCLENGVLYINSACGSRAWKPIVLEYPRLKIIDYPYE